MLSLSHVANLKDFLDKSIISSLLILIIWNKVFYLYLFINIKY